MSFRDESTGLVPGSDGERDHDLAVWFVRPRSEAFDELVAVGCEKINRDLPSPLRTQLLDCLCSICLPC